MARSETLFLTSASILLVWLFVLFCVLRIDGTIDWLWWLVFGPLWAVFAMTALLFVKAAVSLLIIVLVKCFQPTEDPKSKNYATSRKSILSAVVRGTIFIASAVPTFVSSYYLCQLLESQNSLELSTIFTPFLVGSGVIMLIGIAAAIRIKLRKQQKGSNRITLTGRERAESSDALRTSPIPSGDMSRMFTEASVQGTEMLTGASELSLSTENSGLHKAPSTSNAGRTSEEDTALPETLLITSASILLVWLFVLFCVLRVDGAIGWEWWLVFGPLWAVFIVMALVFCKAAVELLVFVVMQCFKTKGCTKSKKDAASRKSIVEAVVELTVFIAAVLPTFVTVYLLCQRLQSQNSLPLATIFSPLLIGSGLIMLIGVVAAVRIKRQKRKIGYLSKRITQTSRERTDSGNSEELQPSPPQTADMSRMFTDSSFHQDTELLTSVSGLSAYPENATQIRSTSFGSIPEEDREAGAPELDRIKRLQDDPFVRVSARNSSRRLYT